MSMDAPNTIDALAHRLISHRLAKAGAPDGAALTELLRLGGKVMALSRDFGAYLPPSDRLRTLTEAVCAAVAADGCRIQVVGDDDVVTLAGDGVYLGAEPRAGWQGAAARALATGRAVLDGGPGSGGTMWVPLPDEAGDAFAVLELTAGTRSFDDDDAAAARLAAPWLAIQVRDKLGAVPAQAPAEAALQGQSDLPLDQVLSNLLEVAVEIVDADRGAIFFHDSATDELQTQAVIGLGARDIRIPAGLGLVGSVFLSGETLNAPDVYADRRFNPSVDRRTGYTTRNALCVPIVDAQGQRLGVLQAINKRDGSFDRSDERRLKVLSHQVAVVVDYWRVFNTMVEVKTYNDTILASLTDGVLTVDGKGMVTFLNPAAGRILSRAPTDMLGKRFADLFEGSVNGWLPDVFAEVAASGEARFLSMSEIENPDHSWTSVNITAAPLVTERDQSLGTMMVLEDVTREQNFRRTMSRYVHDSVVDTLVNGDGSSMVGARQKVSVLFSDIRSFTSLTENIGAEETVRMLNEYFSYMEDVVTNRRGMVDKYIGDALMALFGAPASAGSDADNAVTAAVDMFQVLRMFNQRRPGEPIAIGIGIATGQVITGDIGSSKRLDFTAIGNPVNLSSRLESLTKFYGTDIMVCGDTFASLEKRFRHRKIDYIRVRGQSKATSIHEIVDHHHPRPRQDELFGQYGEALETYLAGDWESALKQFQACLRIDDADQASRVMLLRCRQLIANPPATWENVWTYR